jgi:hypothetical protein
MLIKLYAVVGDIDDIASRYDRIRVWRATSVNGTYSEITTAATRIPLVLGVSTYTYYDESGAATYWYKTDYYNTATGAASEKSDPVLGDDAEVLEGIMTVDELKDVFLVGVDLTDDTGTPYPDRMYEFAIRAAIAWAEVALDLDLRPTDRTERYAYDHSLFQNAWGYLQLDHYPCLDWDDDDHYVKIYWPSTDDPYEFPSDWIRLEKGAGQLNLIPTSASLSSALMVGGSVLPSVLSRYPFLPRTLEVKYESGFEAGAVPYNIRHLIGMKACFPIFNVAGDLIAGAGIANFSLSADGLSQSIGTTSSATNSGYGARLVQYTKQIKEELPQIKNYYKNPGLMVG